MNKVQKFFFLIAGFITLPLMSIVANVKSLFVLTFTDEPMWLRVFLTICSPIVLIVAIIKTTILSYKLMLDYIKEQ